MLQFQHVKSDAPVQILRIDEDDGNVLKAFDAMGRPPGDLTEAQVAELQAAGAMAPAEREHLRHGRLQISVPRQGLAVVLVGR